MGGVAVKTSAETILVRSHSFLSLMELEEWDHFITQLPSDQDIMDRSKTDIFTIILACLQSLWLVVQCIARAAEGAGISELELSTCGFVMCSLLTYLFWWNKPYGIEHRTIVQFPESSEARVLETMKKGDTEDSHAHQYYNQDRVHSDEHLVGSDLNRLLTALLGILLSAVHLAAWNWAFPSHAELWLWRVASLVLLTTCMAFLALKSMGMSDSQEDVAVLVFLLAYSVSRGTILVQIFLCFRSMPESVYREVVWTQFIPHVA
ncbi:hypothetical protein EG329_006017 [Mollisiaceae sp. DMI_Dod_QoI]|nr:hypothetical protein EG329_006017 [Helotiales sp. DMI_Dod_QoI]